MRGVRCTLTHQTRNITETAAHRVCACIYTLEKSHNQSVTRSAGEESEGEEGRHAARRARRLPRRAGLVRGGPTFLGAADRRAVLRSYKHGLHDGASTVTLAFSFTSRDSPKAKRDEPGRHERGYGGRLAVTAAANARWCSHKLCVNTSLELGSKLESKRRRTASNPMPSEDRRAPPPVTRAGRKAAASEKRPRGRPRKDGVGSCGAPPFHLLPSTSPLPPPSPKSRKKGRSRGQAQVEDEEGVDITDKMRPPRKMAEVTTGHRGSASRRRSNTDPAPTVPRTPPADPPVNLAPPPTSISEEEPPQAAPVTPPRPPCSPAPGRNADMGGASLASSPAQSPGLRPEDDDMPSPLLRRSMSEDSGSPTPSLGLTERRLQQCAFCYRGERPPLGQGPLVVFGPTPGYVPLHVLSRRTSSDRDGDCHDHCYPRSHAVHIRSNSPAQCDDESSFQLLEQLGAIGLPHDIDVQSLFDPTGQCCAHLQCAAWSEGVCRGEGQSLLYVDKAIDSGSTQVCVFCGGLGASLRCWETGCGRSYHFPCAAAAGAHQDWEQRRTLCTRHAHTESRSCVSCSLGDNVGSLLMCCCCGNRYHARCLAPPLTPSSLIRAGWQCVPCRVCQSCRLREDTSVLLVCARCDKAYHTHCLTPPLNHTPDSNWICQSCRVCLRCGVRSSGHWANHPFLCASCDPALPCGVCGHTPDLYSLQDYVTCICCYRCVHTQCISVEEGIGATKCDGKSYVCPTCRPRGAERAALALILHSPAQDIQLTPTHAPDFQNPTEVLPINTTAHSPVHLSSSEQTQTPTEITRLSHYNPVASPASAAELQQSPTRPPTSPTEQKPSLALSPSDPSELQPSPPSSAPSSTELKPNPQSSPSHDTKPQQRLSPEQTPYRSEGSLERSPSDHPDPNQSPESPSNPTELRLRSPQSPSNPTDPQQSLEQSPSNLTVLRQSLLASPANLSVSPRSPPPSSLNHSALHKSPSYSTEPQASLETAPCSPTQFRESPAQSPSEHTNLQPLKSHQAELQLSPVSFLPNTEAVQKSPVRSPSNATDLYLSPLPSPSNVTELRPSTVPFSLEPTAFRRTPVQSPIRNTELQQSPLPCFKVTEFQQSPTPSPSSVTELGLIPLSSTSKPTDRPQSPLTSTNMQDFHLSPTQSPSNVTALHPNPVPFHMVTEIQQTATPSPFKITELQQSPLPSHSDTSDLQASLVPSPNVALLQQNPLLSPCKTNELPRSPVPSPSDTKEILQCPTPTSSKITHLQQSPIPSSSKPTEFHQNLVTSPINVTELRRSPVPSPLNITDLQQSPVPSPLIRTEPQQSPATSPPKVTEIPHRATPLPSQTQDLQQSSKSIPSNVTMIHHSPVPSPSSITELHHSAVTSPSHVTELHPSPPTSPSDVTNLPSPGTSPCDVTQLHQSPATSPPKVIEIPQCAPPSLFKVTELPPSPATSPNVTETQHCPTPYPPDVAEPQQSPATSPPNITELQHSPKPSSHVLQLPRNPIPSQSVTEVPQRPLPFLSTSTALPQSPLPSPSDLTNARLNPVSSQAIPAELQLSPATSPSVPAELHESQVPLPSRATEHSQNFNEAREPSAPSYPCGADLEEGALQSLPCPAELLMSHLRCSENAELHECPAMSHLYPIQVNKDPQVNHVPRDYQDNHGTSPRTPLSSTPPVLPSVTLDLQQRAVLLTSTPSEHSPPSSPPIDSSREKLANRVSSKSPVRGGTMSELSPCGMEDDEAKPVIISPDSRVQDDCSQPTRPLRPADEPLQVQTHQRESFPEAQSPTLAGRSPSQGHKPDVETALDQESDCSPFMACKLEQDLSPGSKPSACRPGTVAGSPSRAPLSSTPCNLLQPISPAPQPARPLEPGAVARQSFAQSSVSQGGGGTELSPGDIPPNRSMDNSQTLESGLCSSATVTVGPATLSRPQSEPGDLPSPAPASLVHQSASVDRSSPSPVSSDAGTAEGVPCQLNDSLDCTSQRSKPLQNPTRPVHNHAGARGASPVDSLQASYDLMTDADTVEHLPGGIGPSSQAGSPVMSADRSSQPCASPSSLDATPPQTAVNHPRRLSEFEKSPASAGDRSSADSLYDPELFQLPQTGPSNLSAVPTCSRPTDSKPSHSTRASPPHSRYAGDGSDSHGPIKIGAEASGCSSDQSSLKTCATFGTCAQASGSPTPTQAAETCPSSLTGSTRLSPEADAQAGSPEQNSLGHDCALGFTWEPSWKTTRKSPRYQLGGSFAASQASTTDPRQFPAPLSPWNDRPASGPTQEHADVPETGCTCQTQARTGGRSQLADSLRSDNAQVSESLERESSTGSAVPTRVGSESGPCLAAPTSAFLCEGESTTFATTDQAYPLGSRRYLPEKTEGEVPDREHNKQLIDAQKMARRQEEKEVQSQEKMKEQHQEEIEEQMQEENRDQHQAEQNCEELPSVLLLSGDEPAAASPFFSAPPSQSSPSLSGSPPPSPPAFHHWGVTSETFLPLAAVPDGPSEWPQGDRSCSQKMLEAAKDVAQSHAGSSERDESSPDAAAKRPNQEGARQSSSEEGEQEPTLDVEVMKLMSSSSPSASPCRPRSLTPPPLSTRSLRPPPRSVPPLDELSIRLRQSPFSTEASPETSPIRLSLTPPPLSPPSPPLSFGPPYRESPPLCKTLPSTVIPLTRKIGMGKPAISKRKFSPGRTRVRQASWWSNVRAVSPPSSSQDSLGEGGRDSPKSRRADSPLWSMRVGRGSGYPGRRRSRGGGGIGGGRGGRGRSRIKTQDFVPVSPAYGFVESAPPKEEEENSMHNTVVMFSTSDVFTLRQDMCVVCGSFGRGAEGRLLACSQCGQCYHPYCVNVKVTRVILTKGWRCLECTVCEACGEATDPGRLLLCDDCDISYHTYCLEPPLHTVPKGAWKCKWCVWCVQCGSASPGPHCEWQNNYSRCGPCASLTCCPLCQRAYTHDDLILQCQQCDRWVHAVCEGLTSEDEVEVAADEGFDCSLCRTRSRIPYGRPDNLDMVQILSRTREADTKTYRQDGVFLTESGLSQLQSLVEPLTSTRRYRRCKPKLKLRIINQNSVSVLQTLPHPDAGHMECEIKSDSSPEREQAPEDDVSKDLVKRKRKPYRPGIGGFTVRQRGGKAAAGVIKACGGKRGSETLQGDEEGAEQTDKVKKRYRKKKTKLEEAFPSYLQEAFFGRDLLYRIRQVDQRILSEAARVSRSGAVDSKGPAPSENLMDAKQERPPLSDEALADLCDVLNTHPHIVTSGHAAGLDINEPLVASALTGSGGQGQKALHEEPLDAILNPELDKMVTDGALLSKLYKIPELEGKDVEDLFTAVLSPDGSQQHNQSTHAGTGAFPRLALLNGLAGSAPDLHHLGQMPGAPVCGSSVPCQPPTDQRAAEGERDTMSTAQRSMMKWEKEEALGEQATVAPVLYCNTNFPQLREQYPEWSTRVKQIAKLWRKASSQDRAPYVQRARDNRAAQRINKVHVCAEPPKRVQPPLRGLHDRVCPDAVDSASKDPLRPRESEQEQEWKLRQGEVKDRWRAGKKRQENTDKGCPFQASLAGGGKEALQMRQKSKQLAKMEASQKLEQVKSEQRQQQQQQLSASQRAGTSPDAVARHGLLQGSSPADDVFLRPQAPPPSGYSSHPHSPRSPHSSSSPQMFSPPSSRPTSPWDPCNKPAGTPWPASTQHCPPLGTSPARDASGSPVPSPDSKASDASRALTLQPGLEHSRAAMKSPPSGSQVYHRSQVQGGLFKAPMPPQNQLQQELFDGAAPGARREPSLTADIGLPRPQDPALHPQLGSPQRNTYAPAPRNPGGDYDHQMAEPFVQQSSLSDAYANPPASGPHRDTSYLRLDRLNMASGHRPCPSRPGSGSDTNPSLPAHLPGLPGSTLTLDHYAQRASTPDPQKTPEAETPAPRLMRSPLGGETATRKQQDCFARTAGTSDHRSAAAHATTGASPVDKMAADDMAAVGAASSEGPLGLLPQLGDSEEKLRQRQRLRQLILRQQQQKSAMRQEKGIQAGLAPALSPAPGSATPSHWPQGVVDEALAEVFGRPPPPYPGTLRLPGPGAFPGERLRGPAPKSSLIPARRGMPLRFGPHDPFPRPPPVSAPSAGLGAPAQMRKPLLGESVAVRPLTATGPHRHDLAAAPQAFPVPVQQHSIMGQPYIELRHRAPENRLRLPFSLVAEAPPPSARAREIAAGQPVLLMVQLNQQDQHNPVHAAAQGNDMALQGAEGIEEHLEGVESAVKDLEDVEVKDLVDLNLNLDPEDGKEDLDLGPNDLHLDDFLLSGKFDLIAYADPELDLEDKKDMFAAELDLGESVGDLKKGGPQKTDDRTDSRGRVKEENPERIQVDHPTPSAPLALPGKLPGPDGVFGLTVASAAAAAGSDLPGSALHLSEVESKESSILPQAQGQGKVASCAPTPPPAPGPQGSLQQSAARPGSAYLALQPPPSGHSPVPQGVPRPCLLLNPNAQPLQREVSAQGQSQEQEQSQSQNQNKGKPLLLEEQPLLLQDLLDQERQEQQQQKQMQALIGHKSTPEPGILDLADFDSISDPIMKAKMVALKGINKVMSQGNLGLNNMVINRFHPAPPVAAAAAQATASQPPLPVAQDPDVDPQLARPNPPSFGAGFIDDSQRRQYEEWLGETQRLLRMQERLLEEQLGTHRKTKKALSAKQRTAKKAGRALAEDDAAQLRRVLEQQAAVQKQLEQIRRQQKDHTALIEDYRSKRQQQRPPSNAPDATLPQPLQSAVQNVPPAWSPLMGRMLASQMPTSAGVSAAAPGPAPTAAGFASAVGGPAAGHGGVSPRDASAPAPQVKFDDNNPFSEGFQERERRERLREQQERHRVQLMQGAERHRMLQQQRPDPDRQGRVQPRAAGPALGGGILGPAPGGDAFSQVPFFSSELPQEFLQSPPGTLGGQTGPPFPPPQRGRTGGLGPAGAFPERGGLSPAEAAASVPQTRPRAPGSLARIHPPGSLPTPPDQAGQCHPFDPDSASSSPSAALRVPLASSSLPQLYANILPEDGSGRGRSVSRDAGARTPPPPAPSDDTPPSADASRLAPEAAGPDPPPSALAPSSELERQLSVCSASQERGALVAADSPRALLCGSYTEVKEEREERGDPAKSECADPGKELLRHLLKEKAPASPGGHAASGVYRRLSGESARSEDEDGDALPDRAMTGPPGVSDALSGKKPQRCKRAVRPDKDKNLSKCKRRRREDEEENDDALNCSSSASEQLMTHLTQLSALPLMEPVLGLDLSLFPAYGSSSPGRDSVLSGSFGNACLDGVADYYAQLACKNILGNPPTPPASLPPTPPPAAKQKLLNGFAAAEAASGKDAHHLPPEAGGEHGAAFGPDPGASRAPFEGGPASEGKEPRGPADVDVPASLPTPPHNNQEELRTRDSSPGGDPDGFVPSSSPESVADAELSRYPDLSFVKTEALSPCPSPPIPMTPCSRGKGSALKREVKTEPGRQSDLVTVAVALNPSASQNVPAVMAMLAELLRVPASVGYRLSLDPLAPLAGVSAPLPEASASGRRQRAALPTAASGDSVRRGRGGRPAVSRPPSCSFCKVLLGNGVRKIKEEGPPSLLFCSPNCSALYSSGPKGGGGADEPAVPPPPQHRYANNMSSIAVHSLPAAPVRSADASPPPRFPSASVVTMETRPRVDDLKVKVKLKPHPQAFPEGDDSPPSRRDKRLKSSCWRRWNANVALSRGPVSDKMAAAPTEEEVDVLLKKLGACLRPEPFPVDQRRCCFCHQQGDGETDGPARLLNLDLDLWVHLNCALWSSEVYETQAGALINVESALRRGLTLRCAHCQQTGATSGCNRLRCTNTYHFTCAIRAHCTFFKDKTMLCQLHRPRTGPASGGSPSSAPGPPPESCAWPHDPYDSELRCFAVFRRVYVQRDEARQVAAMVQRGERRHSFRVGSLLFCAVGRLLPGQMSAFHDAAAIFPVGYHANRIYWSMRHGDRRCKYMCFIEEQEARPLFKVKVVENGYDELVLTAPTPKGVWEQILEPVARLRSSSGTLKLFPDFLKGEDLFGLSVSAICRIIESLPGVEACERYTFRYGRNPLMEWPLAFNPSGSARSEPKASQAKRPYLLASMAPRCQGSVGAIVGAVPGVISLSPGETVVGAHQGRHSKLAQYRRMKTDWKTNVYLARSRIQGLGLYAARDIEKCTMVIEYIGAIIRSEVANRKERLYESQNRGVYMFRIDNDYVIDATIAGGPARYINHSCAPNCMTEVVNVEKENKIIISSCRRIQRGEELSYDYKFDLEDDQHKIPCHCGAFNCRKWMN